MSSHSIPNDFSESEVVDYKKDPQMEKSTGGGIFLHSASRTIGHPSSTTDHHRTNEYINEDKSEEPKPSGGDYYLELCTPASSHEKIHKSKLWEHCMDTHKDILKMQAGLSANSPPRLYFHCPLCGEIIKHEPVYTTINSLLHEWIYTTEYVSERIYTSEYFSGLIDSLEYHFQKCYKDLNKLRHPKCYEGSHCHVSGTEGSLCLLDTYPCLLYGIINSIVFKKCKAIHSEDRFIKEEEGEEPRFQNTKTNENEVTKAPDKVNFLHNMDNFGVSKPSIDPELINTINPVLHTDYQLSTPDESSEKPEKTGQMDGEFGESEVLRLLETIHAMSLMDSVVPEDENMIQNIRLLDNINKLILDEVAKKSELGIYSRPSTSSRSNSNQQTSSADTTSNVKSEQSGQNRKRKDCSSDSNTGSNSDSNSDDEKPNRRKDDDEKGSEKGGERKKKKAKKAIPISEYLACPYAKGNTSNVIGCLIIHCEDDRRVREHLKLRHRIQQDIIKGKNWNELFRYCHPTWDSHLPLPEPYFEFGGVIQKLAALGQDRTFSTLLQRINEGLSHFGVSYLSRYACEAPVIPLSTTGDPEQMVIDSDEQQERDIPPDNTQISVFDRVMKNTFNETEVPVPEMQAETNMHQITGPVTGTIPTVPNDEVQQLLMNKIDQLAKNVRILLDRNREPDVVLGPHTHQMKDKGRKSERSISYRDPQQGFNSITNGTSSHAQSIDIGRPMEQEFDPSQSAAALANNTTILSTDMEAESSNSYPRSQRLGFALNQGQTGTELDPIFDVDFSMSQFLNEDYLLSLSDDTSTTPNSGSQLGTSHIPSPTSGMNTTASISTPQSPVKYLEKKCYITFTDLKTKSQLTYRFLNGEVAVEELLNHIRSSIHTSSWLSRSFSSAEGDELYTFEDSELARLMEDINIQFKSLDIFEWEFSLSGVVDNFC